MSVQQFEQKLRRHNNIESILAADRATDSVLFMHCWLAFCLQLPLRTLTRELCSSDLLTREFTLEHVAHGTIKLSIAFKTSSGGAQLSDALGLDALSMGGANSQSRIGTPRKIAAAKPQSTESDQTQLSKPQQSSEAPLHQGRASIDPLTVTSVKADTANRDLSTKQNAAAAVAGSKDFDAIKNAAAAAAATSHTSPPVGGASTSASLPAGQQQHASSSQLKREFTSEPSNASSHSEKPIGSQLQPQSNGLHASTSPNRPSLNATAVTPNASVSPPDSHAAPVAGATAMTAANRLTNSHSVDDPSSPLVVIRHENSMIGVGSQISIVTPPPRGRSQAIDTPPQVFSDKTHKRSLTTTTSGHHLNHSISIADPTAHHKRSPSVSIAGQQRRDKAPVHDPQSIEYTLIVSVHQVHSLLHPSHRDGTSSAYVKVGLGRLEYRTTTVHRRQILEFDRQDHSETTIDVPSPNANSTPPSAYQFQFVS